MHRADKFLFGSDDKTCTDFCRISLIVTATSTIVNRIYLFLHTSTLATIVWIEL